MTPDPFRCGCFDQYSEPEFTDVRFHAEEQDTTCRGWQRLLELIEEAASAGWEAFDPLEHMAEDDWVQLVTLPPSIGKLKSVKRLMLARSTITRLPVEIGQMDGLQELVTYTSYRIHWYPYELTHCKGLRRSSVSTRALYGNFKARPPFPRLTVPQAAPTRDALRRLPLDVVGSEPLETCSVCAGPLAGRGLYQRWISLGVATDVLPLLVNACSPECVAQIPAGARSHVPTAHSGGPELVQPAPMY